MDVERQQGRRYQLELFPEFAEESLRPDVSGEGGTGAAAIEESQASAASERKRALARNLMEQVADPANMNKAWKKVKANKGAPGCDGMTIDEALPWLAEHRDELFASLLDGSYRPQTVRGVEIPKPGGGVRRLGIPTVRDRVVQQAIQQVLTPIFDPEFSESSFGFRPGRGAHDALRKAGEHVAEGRIIVVDCDLEKFFDRVNHDMLMARLARRLGDKRLLRIIRRFLEAGIMQDGVCIRRHEGTPQGGPLSPLLSNILLDDFDKELERRGHRFVRYADDCHIYVQTQAAGERVMASIIRFLEGRLRLKVNREKSAVDFVEKRKFLGHRLLRRGDLGIAPKSLARAKDRIRQITKRNRGRRFERVIEELNSYLTGWVTYYRHARCKTAARRLDEWIRRKLRCYRLKQRKRTYSIMTFLKELGVPEWRAWRLALSGKGWWRRSGSPPATEAMTLAWFDSQGLVNLSARYAELNR